MEKYLITFLLKNSIVQYNLDDLVNDNWNGILHRSIVDGLSPALFPIKEMSGLFFVEPNRDCSVMVNGEVVDKAHILKHGDIVNIIEEMQRTTFQLLSLKKINLEMKKYCFTDALSFGSSINNNLILDFNEAIPDFVAIVYGIEKKYIRYASDNVEDIIKVYVNGKAIPAKNPLELFPGDQINIGASVFVYFPKFIFVPSYVKVNLLTKYINYETASTFRGEKLKEVERTLRIIKNLKMDDISIDGPPAPKQQKQLPFILTAGPSMTMAMAMLFQLSIAYSDVMQNGNYSSLLSRGVMAASMLIGAIVWPILSRKYAKEEEEKEEILRRSSYSKYLEDQRQNIDRIQAHNRTVWNNEYCPSMDTLLMIIEDGINGGGELNRIWEKDTDDYDFLMLRLGMGNKEFEAKIKAPEKHFSLTDDSMLDDVIMLAENKSVYESIPISIALKENRNIGIFGDAEELKNQIWCMLTSLTVLHAPDDVRLVFIVDPAKAIYYDWVLSIPHLWSEDRNYRYFATNKAEVRSVFVKLSEENLLSEETKKIHHVVFILNDSLVEDFPFDNFTQGEDSNFTFIYAMERFSLIPKVCKTLILFLEDEGITMGGLYQKNQNDNRLLTFQLDHLSDDQVKRMENTFAHMRVKTGKSVLPIPESINFLTMYQVGNVRSLMIKERWEKSRVSRSLAAPIGVKQGNELFFLDIHEKYHGCHGLVAGTTGSGKSEFLQEYIASLMINYSPQQVAFLLIDFKGGDMARPFLDTPHLAATISNLSGSMIYRARVSLEAEIKRRQNLFNRVTKMLGVDKLDINSYHKYFETGRVAEPLPHLVIIIDEFAQMKSQNQEFLGYLIDVAQVGRSLGIHLILATQKPSGVVSPQIWSNSRFKVCLKVLDGEDSKEMIRRNVAANIKYPGRAYVQVGYDEVFEQIQTGYSGAEYVEHDYFLENGEDSIEQVDCTLTVSRYAKDHQLGKKTDRTQLEEVVDEIIKTGEKMNLHVNPLWLPVLNDKIFLEELLGKKPEFDSQCWNQDRNLSVVLGRGDLPMIQEQPLYEINFLRDGHLAIYGASGVGKTSFLTTLLFSMALKYSPKLFQCYIIDLGGRNLVNAAIMPHCMDIAFDGEDEKIENIFFKVINIVEERKNLFTKVECSSYESYMKITGEKLPAILLIVDNYASFRSRYPSNEMDIIELAANAKNYGIFIIVTGNSRNAIYYKLAEHISSKIVFFMNDKTSYRDILNTRIPIELDEIKGRALAKIRIETEEVKNNKSMVRYEEVYSEVQFALPFDTENEAQMMDHLKKIYVKMQEICPKDQIGQTGYYTSSYRESSQAEGGRRKNSNSTSSSSKRKGPIVLPAITNDEKHFLCGYSTFDHRNQGFDLEEVRHVAIHSKDTIAMVPYVNDMSDKLPYNIYYFTLNKDVDVPCQIISTEEDINFFVDSYEMFFEQAMENPEEALLPNERLLLIIEDFTDFYDTISDDDLTRLDRKLLMNDSKGVLLTVTGNVFPKLMGGYAETGLYLHISKSENGMVIGGSVEDQYASTYLHAEFTDIPQNIRQKVLMENQGLVYQKKEVSIVDLIS